jgi:hypothetical protein
VDRRHELENVRRSIAMLTPGMKVMNREEALTLLEELGDVLDRLDRLRQALRRLADGED